MKKGNRRFILVLFLAVFGFGKGMADTFSSAVTATDEGDEGLTIAGSFHVIVENDWFVALPSSDRAENDASWSNRVRVTAVSRGVTLSFIAPIWDVGPWNTDDDYWLNDSNRPIYGTMANYWTNNRVPARGVTAFPPGWTGDTSVFPIPPTSETNYVLDQGIPEAQQAFNDSRNQPEMLPTMYNYACDEMGRSLWNTGPHILSDGTTQVINGRIINNSPLNGAAIDLADGVFNTGLQLPNNQAVTWNITSDLPSVQYISLVNQQGVTLYSRMRGQPTPTINLPLSANQAISVIIQFNQSMLEAQADDDSNFVTATKGVSH